MILRGSKRRCPHLVISRFLGADVVECLLSHVEKQRTAFEPATVSVYHGEARVAKVNVESRDCLRLADICPFRPLMKQAIGQILPTAMAALGILGQTAKLREFECCAYGDRSFFLPHIDTSRTGPRRVISCVYYFFREPARFTGGELRLYAWRRLTATEAAPPETIDIIPECDSLVLFPSALRHEVRPVACPSGEWRDFRFTINCWAYMPAQSSTVC